MKLGFLKDDLGLKLVALVLGTVLWVYVQSLESAKSTKSFQIPLQIENNNPELAFVSATDPDGRLKRNITVTMKGLAEELEDLKTDAIQRAIHCWIDLSELQAGEQQYSVKFRVNSTYARFEWDWERRIVVNTEQVLREEHPVRIVTTGSTQVGLDYGDAALSPSTVEVIGPESQVRQVREVRVLLDLQKAQSGVDQEVPVEMLDMSERPVERVTANPASIKVKPVLTPSSPWRQVFVAPRFVGNPKSGYRVVSYDVKPEIIEVQGEPKLLRLQGTIPTAAIELEGASTSFQREARLALPSGLKLRKPVRIIVRVTIESETPPDTSPGAG